MRFVAGGTVGLRSAGCSTSRLDVFAVLVFVFFALVAGGNLLHRVLAHHRVQPEQLIRLSNIVIIDFGCENADVGALGNRRSSLGDSRPHLLQLRVGLHPPSAQLVQAQPWVPSPNEFQRPPGSEAGR